MNYRSFADLSKDIRHNLHKIPQEVTLIVGIPRSGLLAANLISLYARLPLTDIDSFLEGKILCPTSADATQNKKAFQGKILIVDDSVATGKAIVDAREKLKPVLENTSYNLLFCCVYADPDKKHLVDIPLLLLNRPRVFEWNLFHNKIMEKTGVHLKGFLAHDNHPAITDTQEKHFKTLLQASPYIIPKKTIGTVFHSAATESKEETEQWLKQNDVLFSELVVAPELDLGLEYKKRKHLNLFIENSKEAAQRIFETSGKDVYCLENNTFYSGAAAKGLAASLQRGSKRFLQQIKRKLKHF